MNSVKNLDFDSSSLPFFEIEAFNGSAAQLDFFNFAVEFASDEIFLMHKDSQLLYVNESACKHLGYTQDELLGKYVWEWDPIVTQQSWSGLWAETVDKKHLHFQTQHRRKSGETFPVEIHSYYYERAGEQFSVAICNEVSDINQQQHLIERELLIYKKIFEKRINNGDMELKALLDKALEELDSP